jgi:hypothetical protein
MSEPTIKYLFNIGLCTPDFFHYILVLIFPVLSMLTLARADVGARQDPAMFNTGNTTEFQASDQSIEQSISVRLSSPRKVLAEIGTTGI